MGKMGEEDREMRKRWVGKVGGWERQTDGWGKTDRRMGKMDGESKHGKDRWERWWVGKADGKRQTDGWERQTDGERGWLGNTD